ncbi:hypothetical protein [Paracoccus sp. SSK6]|uniref:hypothetical protein n=1 Tax=Paracoccus sp. SSK6 TaxID=3143131 RepID=UPI00321BA61A
MLRLVVGAKAANMMLVQCRFDVPISLACSMWFGVSPVRLDPHGFPSALHLSGFHQGDLQSRLSQLPVQPLRQRTASSPMAVALPSCSLIQRISASGSLAT